MEFHVWILVFITCLELTSGEYLLNTYKLHQANI